MQAVLNAEFLAVVPAPIRERLHLKPGMSVEFDETAPFLKATPAFDVADMMSCIGVGKGNLSGMTASDWLDETRGPVELPPER